MTTATNPIQIENGITNFQPDLTGFYFPEVCYLAESKRIKTKADANFRTWINEIQMAFEKEDSHGIFCCLPISIGQCTKNVVKNTTKKFQARFNDARFSDDFSVKEIMSRISGGLEEYAKLNASWKANKSRLLSGKRPAEKPDPMLVWVHDAVALEALEELASDSKEQIKGSWLKSANAFIAKCIETNFAPPHSQDEMELDALAKTYGSWDSWKRREKMQEENNAFYQKVRVLFVKVTARTLRQSNHTPITAEQLEVLAQEYADGVWMDFIHKMGQKIGGLGITSLTTTTTIGTDHWESTLVCEARNGVTFNVNNSIVWKCNQYGTNFVQFPARFSDVKQNGIPVKNCADVSSVRRICDFKAFTK